MAETKNFEQTGISEQILKEIFELKKYIGKVELKMNEISDTISEISTRTGSSSRKISDTSSQGSKNAWAGDFSSKTAYMKAQNAGITAADIPLEKRSGCSGKKITCKDIKIYTDLNNIDTGEKRCEGVNAKGEVCGQSGNNQCGTSYYCHRHANAGKQLHKRRVADARRERMEDVLSGVEELEGGDLYNKDNPPEIYLEDGQRVNLASKQTPNIEEQIKEMDLSDDEEDPFVKKLPIKPIIKKKKTVSLDRRDKRLLGVNKKIMKEEIIKIDEEPVIDDIEENDDDVPDIDDDPDPDIDIDDDKDISDIEDPEVEEDYPSDEEEESVDD